MSDLPPEILFDILSRLPPKDLIRFLCISKVWYATINDHRFIKAHLQRSIQNNSGRTILLKSGNAPPSDFFSSPFDDTETFGTAVKMEQPLKFHDDLTVIVGYSINGVVCLRNYFHKGFALWNPSIQKLKKIPFPTLEIEQQPPSDLQVITQYGFGYDSASEDYKILAILEFDISRDDGTVSSQLQIYSMKSNSWKRIQNMPGEGFSVQMGVVVFSNGAMSWLMKRRSQAGKNQYMILTLDLASEKYLEFDTPVDEDDNSVLHLHVLGGSLCICVYGIFASSDIWVMKEYGVAKSWTLVYSTEGGDVPHIYSYYKPLAFSKNGELVLLIQDSTTLLWWDLKKKRAEQVQIHGLPYSFDATICAGSLSLLDGNPVIVGRQQ